MTNSRGGLIHSDVIPKYVELIQLVKNEQLFRLNSLKEYPDSFKFQEEQFIEERKRLMAALIFTRGLDIRKL